MEKSLLLGTRLLRLVRPGVAYLDGLDALLNDPAVAGWLGGFRSLASVEETIRREDAHWADHGFGPWLLVDAADGAVVGRGGLRYAEVAGKREVELFYAVSAALRGAGLGSFMVRSALALGFQEAGVPSVAVFTVPDNAASLRLIGKFGFAKEDAFQHAGLPHLLFRLDKATWDGGRRGDSIP